MVDLIAVGYSLGLAASVLYLGAIGDRYGRKTLLVLGMALTIPASILAAIAPTDEVLFLARVFGGVAAGMAYPTTLALITALWSGPERTKSIALWSALGGGDLGARAAGRRGAAGRLRLVVGLHRQRAAGGDRPLLRLALRPRPRQRDDRAGRPPRRHPLDRHGRRAGAGDQPGAGTGQGDDGGDPRHRRGRRRRGVHLAPAARQEPAVRPRTSAARPTFWVAALAGIIVFGSLMGAMFIGQQFVQNVLGYSTFQAGLAILPGAIGMILVAPQSAKLVESRGSRFTLLVGDTFCLLGFLVMFLLWDEGASYFAGRPRLPASWASGSASPAPRPRAR